MSVKYSGYKILAIQNKPQTFTSNYCNYLHSPQFFLSCHFLKVKTFGDPSSFLKILCEPKQLNQQPQQIEQRKTGVSNRVGEERSVHTANGKPKPQSQRFFLTFRQLNALAGMILLSATGLVSVEDLTIVVFSLVYINFLSKVAFPPLSPQPNPRVFGEKNRLQDLYVLFSGIISLVFPSAYILEGILIRGNKDDVRVVASHVFLLASQIFMEGVAFYGGFSMPVFVFVPVFYNSRRIFTVIEWLRTEFYKTGVDPTRLYIGRGLAVVNVAFWCFNLFGFLLPVFLPGVFKMYYHSPGYKDEH